MDTFSWCSADFQGTHFKNFWIKRSLVYSFFLLLNCNFIRISITVHSWYLIFDYYRIYCYYKIFFYKYIALLRQTAASLLSFKLCCLVLLLRMKRRISGPNSICWGSTLSTKTLCPSMVPFSSWVPLATGINFGCVFLCPGLFLEEKSTQWKSWVRCDICFLTRKFKPSAVQDSVAKCILTPWDSTIRNEKNNKCPTRSFPVGCRIQMNTEI